MSSAGPWGVFAIAIQLKECKLLLITRKHSGIPTQHNLNEVNKPTKSIKCALLSPILQSFLLTITFSEINFHHEISNNRCIFLAIFHYCHCSKQSIHSKFPISISFGYDRWTMWC